MSHADHRLELRPRGSRSVKRVKTRCGRPSWYDEMRIKYFEEKQNSRGYDISSTHGEYHEGGIRPISNLAHEDLLKIVQFAVTEHNTLCPNDTHMHLSFVRLVRANYNYKALNIVHRLTLVARDTEGDEAEYRARVRTCREGCNSLLEFTPCAPSATGLRFVTHKKDMEWNARQEQRYAKQMKTESRGGAVEALNKVKSGRDWSLSKAKKCIHKHLYPYLSKTDYCSDPCLLKPVNTRRNVIHERDSEFMNYHSEMERSRGYNISSSYGYYMAGGIRPIIDIGDESLLKLAYFATEERNRLSQGSHDPLEFVSLVRANYQFDDRNILHRLTLTARDPNGGVADYYATVNTCFAGCNRLVKFSFSVSHIYVRPATKLVFLDTCSNFAKQRGQKKQRLTVKMESRGGEKEHEAESKYLDCQAESCIHQREPPSYLLY